MPAKIEHSLVRVRFIGNSLPRTESVAAASAESMQSITRWMPPETDRREGSRAREALHRKKKHGVLAKTTQKACRVF